ncbi:MAG TPA: hypothetical protein VEA79_11295 [Phenylobacterium sp.]|nr:hypothetical protein [Phenylobacterium sp.]
MRTLALIAAVGLIAAPAAAQSVDPAIQALNTQIAIEAENARRAQAEAQRDADVVRQRLETEQRIQAIESRQAQRRLDDLRLQSRPAPPPVSPHRIAPRPNALQTGKSEAKLAS